MANEKYMSNWSDEDAYWRTNYRNRPYASGGRNYEYYQPGYRYGYEAANQFGDRSWNDVEPDLGMGWDDYEHRGESTWDQIKDAVRDAWDRVTGKRHVSTR